MFKTSLPRKMIITYALMLVAIIVGLILVFFQVNNLRNLLIEVENEEMAMERARELLARRLEFKVNAPVYQERLDWLDLKIPINPEEEEILRYFDYLAEELEIDVNDIRFAGRIINSDGGFVEMPLIINVEGRYRNLIGLLDYLRNSNRAIRVDSFNINLISLETMKLRLSLSARAFHRIHD